MLVLVILVFAAGGCLHFEPSAQLLRHPLELTLELTFCCVRAHDLGIAVGECLKCSNLWQQFPHCPYGAWPRSPGSQGGGVFVQYGVANLENCNIHDNRATEVCLHLDPLLSCPSLPLWNTMCVCVHHGSPAGESTSGMASQR